MLRDENQFEKMVVEIGIEIIYWGIKIKHVRHPMPPPPLPQKYDYLSMQ